MLERKASMKHYRPVSDRKIIEDFSKISSWKSPLLIAAIYLSVVGIFYLNTKFDSIALFIFSFIFIAGLQSHLMILLHEGAHSHLHPNSKVNKFLSNVFCAFPFLTQSKVYASIHLAHHRYSGNSKEDPETQFYAAQGHHHKGLSRGKLVQTLIEDISGYSALRASIYAMNCFNDLVKNKRAKSLSVWEMLGLITESILIVALCYFTGTLWLLLTLWLIPYMTLCIFFMKIHGYGEHNGTLGKREIDRTFTHEYWPIVNFFFYPIKSGFHFEHHCYPTIPWYNVEKFRALYKDSKEHKKEVEKTTLDGVFFGEKTILNQVLRPSKNINVNREKDSSGIHIDDEADNFIELQLENT